MSDPLQLFADDIAAGSVTAPRMAGLRVTFPVDSRRVNEDYLAAKAAGLSAASAYRWGMYLQWKRHRGERPITLAEAVAQKRAAVAEAALDHFMATTFIERWPS